MQRRRFLEMGSAVLAGIAPLAHAHAHAQTKEGLVPSPEGSFAAAQPKAQTHFALPRPIEPVRASPDRLIDIGVCTRPFRAQGPRIEAERRHGKTIVHHYGHGGSGWSLSWGSARVALPLILDTKAQRIAVIGCGAIGLTTARVAQEAGLQVRIYCRDRPPEVASSRATGMWTPDSRICTSEFSTPAFMRRWEWMARNSFKTYQSLVGIPGEPIQWRDGYTLSDIPFDQEAAGGDSDEPDYPDLNVLVADLRPRSVTLSAGEHPFRVPHVRRFTQMVFNVATYQRTLVDDFLRNGGEIVHREFSHPRELAGLKEHVIVNCTGYGARALFGDESLIPVRGQTARLVPQPHVDYVLIYRGHNLVMVPRHDGLLVQAQGEHDFGSTDVAVNRGLSEAAVQRLAGLFA